MDEAENYQQRLQAIAEKKRAQEEEDRVRRETEEEWLKIAQRKRKSLRDQWLMEPMPSSAEASGTGSTPFPSTQTTEEISTDTPIEIQEEVDQTEDMNDEQASHVMENKASSLSDTITEKPTQPNPGDEDEKAIANLESAETVNTEVILQNGQLERSGLEVMEIQVERDPKTGATTIKSMAPELAPVPVPAAALDPTGEAVFDDGRGTVQAVGNTENIQHSEKELTQIPNAITEVGMKTGLDGDVRIICDEELEDEKEIKEETRDPDVETGDPEVVEHSTEDLQKTTDPTHDSQQQDKTPEKEVEPEDVRGNDMDVREAKVQQEEEGDEEWEMVNCRPEEGLDPMVLSFLGFTQVQAEDQGAVLKAEQVLIGGEEVPEMNLSENPSPVTVENIKSVNEESQKGTGNEESQFNTVESSELCPEEGFSEETSKDVMLDTGAGESVGLHDMDNISDIMDSEDVSTEEPNEEQQTPPQISNDTLKVPDVTEEVPEDSAGSSITYTEDQDRLPARTEAEAQRVEEFPKVEIIKHGPNPEDEIFEDVPLDGKKQTPQTLKQRGTAAQSFEQEPEIQALVSPDVSPNRARGGGEITKHKTCQCCSVM